MDKSVLVVSSNMDSLRLMLAALRERRVQVHLAETGRDGVNKAGYLMPDVIVVDDTVRDMDPLALCRLVCSVAHRSGDPAVCLISSLDTRFRCGREIPEMERLEHIDKAKALPFVLGKLNLAQETRLRSGVDSQGGDAHLLRGQGALYDDAEATFQFVTKAILRDLTKYKGVEFWARMSGTNRSRLNDIFRSHSGLSVSEWYRHKRLERAAELLQRTRVSIQGISDELGFSSSANFASAFKKEMGVSPREFRLGQVEAYGVAAASFAQTYEF